MTAAPMARTRPPKETMLLPAALVDCVTPVVVPLGPRLTDALAGEEGVREAAPVELGRVELTPETMGVTSVGTGAVGETNVGTTTGTELTPGRTEGTTVDPGTTGVRAELTAPDCTTEETAADGTIRTLVAGGAWI
jgi:hypothetical protein